MWSNESKEEKTGETGTFQVSCEKQKRIKQYEMFCYKSFTNYIRNSNVWNPTHKLFNYLLYQCMTQLGCIKRC